MSSILLLFADTNGRLSRYDKAQLVPFVERFPFVEFFLNKVDIFKWVNWGEHAGFGLGNKTSMIKIHLALLVWSSML